MENNNQKCKHQYDVLKISTGVKGMIHVDIDCSCGDNEDESVVSFYNNSVLSAEDNLKGWLSQVAPWFIQNGYKIRDEREGKECSNEN